MKGHLFLASAIGLLAASAPLADAGTDSRGGLTGAWPEVVESLLAPHGNPGSLVADVLRSLARAEGVEVAASGRCRSFTEAAGLHAARLGLPPLVAVPDTDPDLARALGCLLDALYEADIALDDTFHGLGPQDLLRLFTAEDEPDRHLLGLLAGRDHRRNLAAAIGVADAVAMALPLLGSAPRSAAAPIDLEPILYVDFGDDRTYTKNYALILDLGGNDTYDNHAGGVFLAAGNNIFEVGSGTAWLETMVAGQKVAVGGGTQDADFAFSAGLVVDVAGDDVWGVAHPPILTDSEHACGNSSRVPWVGTIGAGILGVGMAFDLAGDNQYRGRTQSQGAGHVFGVGVLYEGPGRDDHEAVRGAMGSGLLGGIGLLIDEAGSSNYSLESPEGGVFNGDRHFCDDDPRYGMGGNFDRKDGPFTPQVGILADLGGDDGYSTTHSSQGFSQGSGFGLLLDAAGHDRYAATRLAQGAGHGRAVPFEPEAPWSGGAGFLIDLAGNDVYSAGSEAQGWALGDWFEDPLPPTDDLDGFLQWTVKREEALGVLFDVSGQDEYEGPAGRGNGVHLVDGAFGLFVDAA